MITSLVLRGKYNIGSNSNNKIKVNDNILSIDKDIPFVRYRFDHYDAEAVEYIKQAKTKFNKSTHLVELNLSSDVAEQYQLVAYNIEKIAKYVYIDITEEDALRQSLSDDKLALVNALQGLQFDRYMLRDKSTSLDTICAKKIIKDLSQRLHVQEVNFGVCSSPLSFGDWACLTAVKARELMTQYSEIADVPLPSANHQCMNCCGCIRYIEINSDTVAPADAKVKGAHKKSENDGSEVKQTKTKSSNTKSKNSFVPGMFSL